MSGDIEATISRGARWHGVWTDREPDRADWNGCEACFRSMDDYETWTAKVADLICTELDLGPDDAVADLGCGTGRIAALIAPRVRSVLALDYSETVLDVARRRRPRHNVTYRQADLNRFDPGELAVTKAYSVGCLFYLDSHEVVEGLIRGLHRRGIAIAATDMPDAAIGDDAERHYDRGVYTHLSFSAERLCETFPGGRVLRPDFAEYIHTQRRFTFVLPGATTPAS
jgi:SAM-dependent methyltransferase